MSVVLRSDQVEAFSQAVANIEAGCKAQIISAPTGTGKTEIGMELIRHAIRKDWRAEFVADRRPLVFQTSERFQNEGIPHGILMGNDTVGVRAGIRVSCAQTILSRGMRPNDLVIVDEAHELYRKMLKAIKASGAFLVGLTATPIPKELAEYYDEMVNVISTMQALRDGILCPFDVIVPTAIVNTDGLAVQSNGEWRKADVSERATYIIGDVVAEWERVIRERFDGHPQPTALFGITIKDAEEFALKFQRAGHDFRVVSSNEDNDHNTKIIKAFNRGEFTGIVNCSMLNRGWDSPHLRILIDCYKQKKSLQALLQRYGRLMRMFPGKVKGFLIDHADNWLAFRDAVIRFYSSGPPPLGNAWTQKATRQKTNHGQSVCRQCRQAFKQGDTECGNCGADRPKRQGGMLGGKVKVVDGVLSVVDSVTGEIAGYDRKRLWQEMCALSLSKNPAKDNHSWAQAVNMYRAMTGSYPWQDFERGTFDVRRDFDPVPLGQVDVKIQQLAEQNFKSWLRSQGKGARV